MRISCCCCNGCARVGKSRSRTSSYLNTTVGIKVTRKSITVCRVVLVAVSNNTRRLICERTSTRGSDVIPAVCVGIQAVLNVHNRTSIRQITRCGNYYRPCCAITCNARNTSNGLLSNVVARLTVVLQGNRFPLCRLSTIFKVGINQCLRLRYTQLIHRIISSRP